MLQKRNKFKRIFRMGVLFGVLVLQSQAVASIPEPWVSLLKTLVETNSSSDNPEGLDKMRTILIAEFKALGFQTRIIDVGGQHRLLIADFPDESPKLLLVGHVDTVFPNTSSFQ